MPVTHGHEVPAEMYGIMNTRKNGFFLKNQEGLFSIDGFPL